MRTALLSDIHANLPALEAVLEECRTLGVDRYVCLGDTVGYAAQPNECCDLVREHAAVTLLGNHDAAVARRMDYGDYYEAARQALDWTRGRLSQANRGWLASLPYSTREGGVEFSHGSPIAPEQYDYIFLADQAAELLPLFHDLSELTLIGHSHLPRAYALSPDGVRALPPREVRLQPGIKYLVSLGSVGQPRDGDPRACFGLLDHDKRTYSLRRVEYDIALTAQRIVSAGLEPHFANRLFAGV